MLCMPFMNRGKIVGILYLENNLVAGAFTSGTGSARPALLTNGHLRGKRLDLQHSGAESRRTHRGIECKQGVVFNVHGLPARAGVYQG